MTEIVWILIAVLAVMSLAQRLIPWLILRRNSDGGKLNRFFGYFAIAAFATLMVENIPSLNYRYAVALVMAAIISIKTKNVGMAVLAAMFVTVLFSYL